MRFWYPFLQLLIGISSGGVLLGIRTTRTELFRKLRELSRTQQGNIDNLQDLIKSFTHPPPKNTDQNELLLYSKLGERFDPRYQSVKRPKQLDQAMKQIVPDTALPEAPNIPLGIKLKNKTFAKYLQLYLHKLSYCPLGQKWIDLGEYLWPRYFKFTHCIPSSCSYPKGLVCRSASNAEPRRVPLLYWTCMPRQRSRSKCGTWGKIYVNIVHKCECSGCV